MQSIMESYKWESLNAVFYGWPQDRPMHVHVYRIQVLAYMPNFYRAFMYTYFKFFNTFNVVNKSAITFVIFQWAQNKAK